MTTLDAKKLGKAIARYREELAAARAQGAENEGQLSHAFANLLRAAAPMAGWAFLEQTAPDSGQALRFDGILRKNFLTRGVWEAKDSKDNLRAEVAKKIARDYPTKNTLFEDTRRAVLYQDGREACPEPFDLADDAMLLRRFNPMALTPLRRIAVQNSLLLTSLRRALGFFREATRQSVGSGA